jgi:hypothetical protein
MAEFLSAAWIAELDAAARAADDLAVDAPFVVEQVVHDDAAVDVVYRVRIGPGGASVSAAPGATEGPADLVLVTDRATARDLHEGRVHAQDALARGSLKVRGRPEVLSGRADLFGRLDAAFAPVRARTTFGDGR